MINYKSRFTVSRLDGDVTEVLKKQVCFWLSENAPKPIEVSDLESNAELDLGAGHKVVIQQSSDKEYFAVKYSHPDSHPKFKGWRVWETEIGFKVESVSSARFQIANSFEFLPGWIGNVPHQPVTTPRLVKRILSDSDLIVKVDGQKVTSNLVSVSSDDVNALVHWVKNSSRRIPLILSALDRNGKNNPVNSAKLAVQTAGNAFVVVEDSAEVGRALRKHREFKRLAPRTGEIRVYMPAPIDGDSEPQMRVFTCGYVLSKPDYVREVIADGIVRRSLVRPSSFSLTVKGVVRHDLDKELESLRKKGEASPELIKALEKQNESQLFEIEALKRDNDEFCRMYEQIDTEKDSVQQKLNEEKNKRVALEANLSELKLGAVTNKLIDEIPDTLAKLVDYTEGAFENVVFTKEAKESAAADGRDLDLNKCLRVFKALGESLPAIMFGSKGGDKKQQFKDQTGFDLVMTESRGTKKDKALVRDRVITFEGDQYTMLKHVKFGNHKSSLFRVYFDLDPNKKRIIVGHVGNHLDVMSSRKRS